MVSFTLFSSINCLLHFSFESCGAGWVVFRRPVASQWVGNWYSRGKNRSNSIKRRVHETILRSGPYHTKFNSQTDPVSHLDLSFAVASFLSIAVSGSPPSPVSFCAFLSAIDAAKAAAFSNASEAPGERFVITVTLTATAKGWEISMFPQLLLLNHKRAWGLVNISTWRLGILWNVRSHSF